MWTEIQSRREDEMAHHKRRRAKNRRAGCLLCKPQKANGYSKKKRMRPNTRRKAQDDLAVVAQ
jgi:hypothetical protein